MNTLKNAVAWVGHLFGNNWKMILLIVAFLVILIGFATRCSPVQAAEVTQIHLSPGVSFGCLHGGPVLGLELEQPLAEGLAWDAGTTLWGAAHGIRNNWDFHARIVFNRGDFGAAIGPAYLQNIDEVNGSHAEFSLMLYYRPFARAGPALIHLSNAGTTRVNCGRNAGILDLRLR